MIALIPFVLTYWRTLLLVAFFAAVAAAGLHYRHQLIVEGEQKALQQVEDANAKASTEAQSAAKNVDDCFVAGGTWDRSRGECMSNNPAGQ
jgi:hypothetical protein